MFRRLHTLLLAPLVLAALVLMPVAPVHAAPPGEAGPPDDSAPPGQGAAEVSDMQVIPALKEWHADRQGENFSLGGHVVVPKNASAQLRTVAETFAQDLKDLTGTQVPVNSGRAQPGDIQLGLDGGKDLGEEGYELQVDGVLRISAHAEHGVFNGTRSVLQLLTRAEMIPAGTARDWPTKPVRSVLVDNTPRHFSMPWWESFFRQMSYYKLNDTNLYIDGAGLTEEEMAKIDELGQRYYVQVVPQLNMPGHMATVLPSHPEYQLRNQDGTLDTQALDLTNEEAVDWSLGIVENNIDKFSSDVWHLGSDEFPSWPGTGEDHPQLAEYAKKKLGPDATFADLFKDFQNRGNERVKSHGKSMRVWNDMIRESDVVTLDKDIMVEYWIDDPTLEGLLSPQEIADNGHQLINADVGMLYYDMSKRNLDVRDLYEKFDVNTFTGNQPVDPDHVAGARIAAWLAWIDTPMESDAEVLNNLRPAMAAMTQHTWGEGPQLSWTEFSGLTDELGLPPGFIGTGHSITGSPAVAENPDGSLAWSARDAEGRLWTGQQHDPASGPWSQTAIAEDVAGDPQSVVDEQGRVHVFARTADGAVVHATQREPGSQEYEVQRQGSGVTGDPAPFVVGDSAGWAARAGDELMVASGGEAVVVAENITGEVAATVTAGTAHLLAPTTDGSVHLWSDGEQWQSEQDGQTMEADPVLVTAGEETLAIARHGEELISRTLEGENDWSVVSDGAQGQPAAAVGPDGEVHVAFLHDGGQVWYAHRADGQWSARVAWYDFVEDPAITVQKDGSPLIMGQNNRGYLAAVQPDPDKPEGDWQWVHLAESTVGTPALTQDAQGRATYVVATNYGDLQTGTRWGTITQWGRDFVVGSINYPGDRLVPTNFDKVAYKDDFARDSVDDYELLKISDSEKALAPEVAEERLQIEGEGYYSMMVSPQALPTSGDATVMMDIEEFADSDGAENSLFLGFVKDADTRVVTWYNRNQSRLGFDIVVDGQSYGGWGDVPASLVPGDKLALTLSGRWVTAYRWHDGQWSRIHTAPVNGTDDITDPQVRTQYHAGFGFRATNGAMAIDDFQMRVSSTHGVGPGSDHRK